MIPTAGRWVALLGGVSLLAAAHARQGSPAPWHQVQRVIDVTGDGRPDTLTLTAFGTQPDTLDLVLRIRVGGRVAFTERWTNTDEFADYDPSMLKDRQALARRVRGEMDAFFDDRNFTPIRADTTLRAGSGVVTASDCGAPLECVAFSLRFEKATAARVARGLPPTPPAGPAYGTFVEQIDRAPFDTVLVRRIGAEWRTSRALSFTYSYGYETTKTIVWSGITRRFWEIFECC